MTDYPTPKVLQFLIDVLDEAERAGTGGLSVIPVVVKEDLPRLLPVLVEVCRFAGHPFTLADNAADGIDVSGGSGSVDSTLKAKVERIAVDPTFSGTPENLVVSTAGDEINVRIGGNPPPTNPGDRNQLGLLTALLDPNIRDHQMAVIAYDETPMSEDSRERMWTFLLDELDSLGGNCRALLVVIGCASFDYARHCREGAGARWAFQDGDVRWRQRWRSDLGSISNLAAGTGPMVLMLGAGVSVSSDMPLGNEIRDDALARLVSDLADTGAEYSEQAAELFQRLASKGRLMPSESGIREDEFVAALTLERVLREEARTCAAGETLPTLLEFDRRQKARLDHAGSAILDLREMLRLRGRLVLLTVNFDQMIEHGAVVLNPTDADPYESSPPGPSDPPAIRLFVTPDDFEEFPAYYKHYQTYGGAVPYVKLHGTIDRPETVRASVDVTLPGLSESAARLLRSLVPDPGGAIPWTYVGCSMRDPDITDVIRTQEFSHRALETWVSPLVDPHVEDWVAQIREPAWRAASLPQSLRERTITQTADVFFRHLRIFLERATA